MVSVRNFCARLGIEVDEALRQIELRRALLFRGREAGPRVQPAGSSCLGGRFLLAESQTAARQRCPEECDDLKFTHVLHSPGIVPVS